MIATETLDPQASASDPPLAAHGKAGAVRLWIDTHVHLHPQHDIEVFLDGAAAHFSSAGAKAGVLCVTEINASGSLGRLAATKMIGPWWIDMLGEHGLVAKRDDGFTVGVIGGRQVRCDDGLEVSVIGRPIEIDDRQPFEASVEAALATEGLTVLAYGVGKWSGARGAKVRALLEDGPADIAFSDNSGRVGLGEQALLKRARELGRTVLVGSDPLPMGMAKQRAGCWGVVVEVPGGDTMDAGWSDRVVDALRHAGPNPQTFGKRLGCVAGIVQQIGLRCP